MTALIYPDGIAIWKLIYYIPCLVGTLYVSWRRGFTKNSSWIFLAIFSAIRIVGSAAQIATISHHSAAPRTIAVAAAAMGLAPLLLSSMSLLSSVYTSLLKQPWDSLFSILVLIVVQTPAVVALVLCTVGVTSADTPAETQSESTVHAGVVIYVWILAVHIVLTFGAVIGRRITRRGEGLFLASVALALPLLLVRLVYLMLAVFSENPAFNLVAGSTTVQLFMENLEEMVVVLIYLWTGLKTLSMSKTDTSSIANQGLFYTRGREKIGEEEPTIDSLVAAVVEYVVAEDLVKQDMDRRRSLQKDESVV